ncbi:hypothetical protein DFH11DRAFT_18171 [Phellopilus nigrolimitatus]|nr:hypothetical protein DFH11DRAFT_18171 [Phellopilus nigrolimitatus]
MDVPSLFNNGPILDYLGLPEDYRPLPSLEPIEFLRKHLRQLPLQLLFTFSVVTTPKQRTLVPTIRNRRLKYTSSQPSNLGFEAARNSWPALWRGRDVGPKRGQGERNDEKEWADSMFLGGHKQHVGKLGSLLGDYAEEREAERLRMQRRSEGNSVPLEDYSDEDSEGEAILEDSPEEARANFERLIRERFIYGLLDLIDYDVIDWSDQWDSDNEREEEEHWFDDEEEGG